MLANGGIEFQMLQVLALSDGQLNIKEVFSRLDNISTDIDTLEMVHMTALEVAGFIEVEDCEPDSYKPPKMAVTDEGRTALQTAQTIIASRVAPTPSEAPGVATATTVGRFKEGNYYCPELGRNCQRPGAFRAFDLPSVINGKIHHRKAPDA